MTVAPSDAQLERPHLLCASQPTPVAQSEWTTMWMSGNTCTIRAVTVWNQTFALYKAARSKELHCLQTREAFQDNLFKTFWLSFTLFLMIRLRWGVRILFPQLPSIRIQNYIFIGALGIFHTTATLNCAGAGRKLWQYFYKLTLRYH